MNPVVSFDQRSWIELTHANALPAVAEVLSRPDGPIPQRGEAFKSLAILRFFDGVFGAICIVDPSQPDVHATLWGAERILINGIRPKLERCYRVSEALFNAIVASVVKTEVVNALKRDDQDDVTDNLLRRALLLGSNDLHFLGGPATTELRVHRNGVYAHFGLLSTGDARLMLRALYTRLTEKSKEGDWSDDQPMRGQQKRELWPGKWYALRFQSQNAHPDCFDVTIRLLPLGIKADERSFAALGFLPDQVRALHHMLDQPRGMVAMVGPTGSGKSTSLVAELQYLLRRHEGGVKIQTLEDPVEYEIPGVRQANVAKALPDDTQDMLWERALTTLMRMKPDIVMLGEIRNSVTARIGVMLNRTGHKFLSSFHADDVFSYYDRLVEFGIALEALLDDGFVAGIVRQRLVPLLCQVCSVPYDVRTAPKTMTEALRRAAPAPEVFERIRVQGAEAACLACKACAGTGHSGQTVLAEILLPDSEINDTMSRPVSGPRAARKLWRQGKAGHLSGGHTLMLEHGLTRVLEGRVSPICIDRQVQTLTLEHVSKLGQQITLPDSLGDAS